MIAELRPTRFDIDGYELDFALDRCPDVTPTPRDARLRHRLHPHRLPDAGDRRVPDAAGLEHLLAARLRAGVGRVPDADDQFVLARPSARR